MRTRFGIKVFIKATIDIIFLWEVISSKTRNYAMCGFNILSYFASEFKWLIDC